MAPTKPKRPIKSKSKPKTKIRGQVPNSRMPSQMSMEEKVAFARAKWSPRVIEEIARSHEIRKDVQRLAGQFTNPDATSNGKVTRWPDFSRRCTGVYRSRQVVTVTSSTATGAEGYFSVAVRPVLGSTAAGGGRIYQVLKTVDFTDTANDWGDSSLYESGPLVDPEAGALTGAGGACIKIVGAGTLSDTNPFGTAPTVTGVNYQSFRVDVSSPTASWVYLPPGVCVEASVVGVAAAASTIDALGMTLYKADQATAAVSGTDYSGLSSYTSTVGTLTVAITQQVMTLQPVWVKVTGTATSTWAGLTALFGITPVSLGDEGIISQVRCIAQSAWLKVELSDLNNGGSVSIAALPAGSFENRYYQSSRGGGAPLQLMDNLAELNLPGGVYSGALKNGAYGWYLPEDVEATHFLAPSAQTLNTWPTLVVSGYHADNDGGGGIRIGRLFVDSIMEYVTESRATEVRSGPDFDLELVMSCLNRCPRVMENSTHLQDLRKFVRDVGRDLIGGARNVSDLIAPALRRLEPIIAAKLLV